MEGFSGCEAVASRRELDGGTLLADALVELGVTVAFGVHGGHLDALLVAMNDRKVRLLDTRHEAVAVNAADGYARASGELGVAFATAGAGLSNAVAGLSTAYADRSPVLLFTSSPPRRDAETNPLQGGIDQVGMVRPVSKWAHQVTVAEEIPRLVGHAARIARTGPPGPVVLDIPVDVLFGPVNAKAVTAGGGARLPFSPAPAPRGVEHAVELLRSAERPAVIVGGGMRTTSAKAPLVEFVELVNAPVFHQSNGVGTLPAGHRCNGNTTKDLGTVTTSGQGPDVVLVIGARFGKQLGGRQGSPVPLEATVVQVDVDPAEIGRLRPVEVGLTADAGEALTALVEAAREFEWPDRADWLEVATGTHRQPHPAATEPAQSPAGIHPYHAVREVLRAAGGEPTIVVDGGEMAGWTGACIHEASPRRAIGFGGYLGFLGIGAGLAIGAQVAEPDRPVVLLVGDGSVGFHLQEFDTFARHDLPILVAVVNNRGWAMSSNGQHELYGQTGEVISHLPDTDYEAAARALGARGERIRDVNAIGPAVAKWRANRMPTCLNIAVSSEVVHPSTPAAVGKTDDPNVIVVPYYENVPR